MTFYLPAGSYTVTPTQRCAALYIASCTSCADRAVLCLQALCVAAVFAVCLGVACAQPFAPGQGFLPSGRAAIYAICDPLVLQHRLLALPL